MGTQTITPEAFNELLAKGAPVVIDVRTAGEFARARVRGAKLMPLDKLDAAAVVKLRGAGAAPICVLCEKGGRAAKAADRLAAAGVANVLVVEGGTAGCEQAGLAIERSARACRVSLERQVRIVAGLLVLAGTVLGYFVNAAALIVPAFVGAGLAFAGITDTCGMAMLLAKMPWNRAR
ncbi:MAG TPA: rhodanese family protein [Phycisphaerae bacterium]|nr:rhodanese family protein [Phycisphaerae bacterium]